MHRQAHTNSKNNSIFTSGIEISEREYLLGSAFLVSFTAPSKQPFRVHLAFKSCYHLPNSYIINKFTILLEVKVENSCLKLLLNLILDSFTHANFGERLLSAVTVGLNFSLTIP